MKPELVTDSTGVTRCWWCGTDPLYVAYHDGEWGMPVTDDRRLFEKICLEGFQAGLSWLTILRKRDNFRRAFAAFDFEKVARFNKRSVERLLGDAGIVRHRGKIESVLQNARRAQELVEEFGSLASFFWQWEVQQDFQGLAAKTAESTALSKELKNRGWSFVGPTTVYAFMQAMGLVNDHLPGCSRREAVADVRRRAKVPRVLS